MKRYTKPGARWLAGALALVMVFVFAAPPAGAAEAAAEAPPATSDSPEAEPQPTLLAMADAKVQEADPAQAMAPAQTSEVSADKPFLKSPQGILAVSLLVAGTILVAYSRSNDRPTSPVRE